MKEQKYMKNYRLTSTEYLNRSEINTQTYYFC